MIGLCIIPKSRKDYTCTGGETSKHTKPSFEPDRAFAVLYGEAPAGFSVDGVPIPVMDLLIGVTAKANTLSLLTRDPIHFSRLRGLANDLFALLEYTAPDSNHHHRSQRCQYLFDDPLP